MKTPVLIPVDLSKGSESKHPDIKADGTEYLCRIDGKMWAGTFSVVWFGLSFNGWSAPLQYDSPGYNSSRWEAVWEIKKR